MVGIYVNNASFAMSCVVVVAKIVVVMACSGLYPPLLDSINVFEMKQK